MAPADSAAQALRTIADQVSRLPAYDHRNPHAFHEGKSELAAQLRAIARLLSTERSRFVSRETSAEVRGGRVRKSAA